MKDFYDLWVLLRKGMFDSEILKEAIQATLKNRNTAYVEDHPVFKLVYLLAKMGIKE